MAVRTIANGGGNWSANGTWVEGVVPTSSDDVVATATSGSVTVDTTTCAAKSVDFTNYPVTSTFTITAGKALGISGNFKLIAGMNINGTGNLTISSSATVTTANLTLPWNFIISAATFTLVGNLIIQGYLYLAGNSTLVGNYNITCAVLYMGISRNITFVAGTTITITTGIYISANSSAGHTSSTLKSGTPSSPVYFVYQGNQENSQLVKVIFTDIDASGSAIKLYNYQGGALTRTINIENVILPPTGGSSGFRGIISGGEM